MSSGPLLSIRPETVIFEVELSRPAYFKVINNSKHYVAFKVKTTSPEKYSVQPNTRVLQPWDTCIIMVTLQAQTVLPPDLECMDKFVIESTILPPHLFLEDIPPDLFNKDDNKVIEECTLRVSYVRRPSIVRGPHILKNARAEETRELQRLREELASTLQQNKHLQQEMEMQHLREELTSTLQQNKHLQQEMELQRLREKLASTLQQNKLLEQKIEMQRRSSLKRTIVFVGLIGLLISILLTHAVSDMFFYRALFL